MNLQPHQERVVAEKAELDVRRESLRMFITAHGGRFESLDIAERARMRRQHVAMCEYATVLGERIAAFRGIGGES